MKYQPFAFWLAALIIGILTAHQFEIDIQTLIIAICILFAFCFLLIITHSTKGFVIMGLLLIAMLGAFRFEQSNTPPSHDLKTSTRHLYNIKISKLLKPSPKFKKYFATILSSDSIDAPIQNQILVYIRNENETLHQDDKLWIYGNLQPIPEAKNPHVFDYRNYMAKKRVYYQIFSDTLVSLEHANSWQHKLSHFKEKTKQKLKEQGFSKTSQIFISSLALGDRMNLNRNFQETLSSAGVMHLFAISGLHVGIVFSFVMLLLYPLLYLPRGKIVRWVAALLVIWLFAWFVDFTSSVTRAVFMISIYYLTQILQRPTNIYHTLSLTAFILLIVDPNELFQVGFQLSYCAVFFIAWLYKPVRNLLPHYRKPYKNYFFDIIAISTTAQFGVMPITVYYFHKFSFLFIIGNLVVIPFASLMVIASIITAFSLHLGNLPKFWIIGTNESFSLIHKFLDFLTSFDSFIFKDISWTLFQVFLLVVLLLLMRSILLRFKAYKLITILLVLVFLQGSRVWNSLQYQNKNELIVFHQYKGTIIGARQGSQLNIFWNVDDSVKVRDYVITPYVLNEHISETTFNKLYDSMHFNKLSKKGSILKFDKSTYYIADKNTQVLPEVDYVILTQSPKKLSKEIFQKTKRIIADGSNYPYIIQKLKKQSEKVYSTAENGAFLKTIQ